MHPAVECGTGAGALACEDVGEFAEACGDGFRIEIAGKDRRPEEPHGSFQRCGVDARRNGRGDVDVRCREGFGKLPELCVGNCAVHRRMSVLYSSKAYSRVER